jgi:hypothetical protein
MSVTNDDVPSFPKQMDHKTAILNEKQTNESIAKKV